MSNLDIRVIAASGILAIGDPHLSGRRPGTRNDVNFVDTVIDKIEQAAEIANDLDLQAIFLGDLFDRDQEPSPYPLVRLIRALKRFKRMPFELMGNHDINETTITDNTSLALLREAGVLNVIDEVGLAMIISQPSGRFIAVGASPYGHTIPADVSSFVSVAGVEGVPGSIVDEVIWITHHDLAFDGAYPGAQELFPIKGCDLVVNGHMHLTKPPCRMGDTVWFNPGNITRQSKDAADHVPSVWEITSARQPAVQHALKYQVNVFSVLEGFVPAALSAKGSTPATSEFVRQLREYNAAETSRTEDGSELAQAMAGLFEQLRVPADVAQAVAGLHQTVTSRT